MSREKEAGSVLMAQRGCVSRQSPGNGARGGAADAGVALRCFVLGGWLQVFKQEEEACSASV